MQRTLSMHESVQGIKIVREDIFRNWFGKQRYTRAWLFTGHVSARVIFVPLLSLFSNTLWIIEPFPAATLMFTHRRGIYYETAQLFVEGWRIKYKTYLKYFKNTLPSDRNDLCWPFFQSLGWNSAIKLINPCWWELCSYETL